MGIEYRLFCPASRVPQLAALLLRLGGRPSARRPEQIEFHFGATMTANLPDVTVITEPAAIYFCDHGGAPEAVAMLLRRLIDEALLLVGGTDSILIASI